MLSFDRLILEVDKILSVVVPESVRVPLHFVSQRYSLSCDPMVKRLPRLVPQRGTAIDVGANQGLYSYLLDRHAARVEAFEPQPILAQRLSAYARAFRRNIHVHGVGLSDRESTFELRVPYVNNGFGKTYLTGLASVENTFDQADVITIPVKTLDSFGIEDVTFVKIDVEGHEARVLDGAVATLSRSRPIIMIEIEQRHIHGGESIHDVFQRITSLGYHGGFYYRGIPMELDQFDEKKHQDAALSESQASISSEDYANNFLFWPEEAPLSLPTD